MSTIEPEVPGRIHGAGALIERFGLWPSFEDVEVLALHFDRGNHLQVIESGAWDSRIPEHLTARLFVADVRHSDTSPLRKPTIVVMRFEAFERFSMVGFNYQNPILGITIELQYSELRKQNLFFVEWGRSALQHDVSFTCESVTVVSVEPCAA